VLSTREPAPLRDSLFGLGITHISAGSQTDPGGYTGAGTDDLHLTVKGRRIELEESDKLEVSSCDRATGQFEIDDKRSVAEIAQLLQKQGFDPVWKDWDPAILDNELITK